MTEEEKDAVEEEKDAAQEPASRASDSTIGAKARKVRNALSARLRSWDQRAAQSQAKAAARARRFGAKGVQTAELVGWAPVSVVCALLGAALVSASVTWALELVWQDLDRRTAQILLVTSSVVALVVLLVWFASYPRASVTAQRFWLLVKFVVIAAGLVALWDALKRAVDSFL